MVGCDPFHTRQTAELAHDAVLSARSEDRFVQDRELELFYRRHASNLTRMLVDLVTSVQQPAHRSGGRAGQAPVLCGILKG